MLADKMAISHSNHLFVPVAFVFCLLSSLVHVSNSYDYTDSRQFEKNPAVSRHRNNIQRLPNYNWKPSDKYYGPRYYGKPQKESTEKNLELEFTKPEDPGQRMVDPRIKKMQEISRQEREKWAAYRRNVKSALDNVEETTKAGKLTNDESITIPTLSKSEEYDENIEEGSEFPMNLFGESESLETNVELDPATSETLVWHPSVEQDSAGVKDDFSDNQFHDSSWLNSKQSADTNIDKVSNKKIESDQWSTKTKNSSEKFPQKATHQRHKDYEISDIKEDLSFKQNAATNYEKSEEDRPSSIINSHSEESISQRFKDSHILKSGTSTRKNLTKSPENDKNFNHTNASKESPKKYSRQFNSSRDNNIESSKENNKENEEKTVNSLMQKGKKNDDINWHSEESILQRSKTPHIPKNSTNKNHKTFSKTSENLNHKIDSKGFPMEEYPRQSSPFQNDREENNGDSKKNKEIIMARSLTWKSKEEKNDAGEKDATEKLNHERSFNSGRWGMSISSPPAEFLKDMSRWSKHQTEGGKNGKHHSFGRWGMSVTAPPKEFFENILMHRGHRIKRPTVEKESKPNKIKGSSNDRLPVHHSRRNLQTALVQQLVTDERYKELARTLLRKVPHGLYNSKYPDPNYWNDLPTSYPTNIDLNNGLFLKFLMRALRSYIWKNNIDIPMSCRIRIPYAPSHI